MKIIAYGGSNSTKSINKKLAAYAVSLFENDEVEILDLNNFAMPLFSVELEAEVGQLQQDFLAKIESADIPVISVAENNGKFSAAFKNVFDWASRINVKVFEEKPMLLAPTSPGGRGGASVLEISQKLFPRYGGNIKASFSLASFNDNFDAGGMKISNPDLDSQLKKIIAEFDKT